MKRFFKDGLISLFLLLFLFSGVTIHILPQSQVNGWLINYASIVRGTGQQPIKLKISDQPSDEMIEYLDGILPEPQGEEAAYGLPDPGDPACQTKLVDLELMWTQIKTEAVASRSGSDDDTKLLALNGDFFEQANHTVFSTDAYLVRQTRLLLSVCLIMIGVMPLTWIFIFWVNSKNLLKLEVQNKELGDLAQRGTPIGVYLVDIFKEKAQLLLDSLPDKFAIVYTDFLGFKYINDVSGYDYGDLLPSEYGATLWKGPYEHELCGRVSADNLVFLFHYKDKSEIGKRQSGADLRTLQYMNTLHDGQLLPTSCGIRCVEDVVETLNIDGLLDRANFAKRAVKTGANQNCAYYDESIRSHLWEEKDTENRMLTAIEDREFAICYQSKVDFATGKIGCSEAPVRWQPQSGTIITPDCFIPVLKGKYMIDRPDQYVYENVCRRLRSLLDPGVQALSVSANVSRLQFCDQHLVDKYISIHDKYSIPLQLLEIEFTESMVFDNSALLLQTTKRFKDAGFSRSIDDFGRDYSSLGPLKSLSIDVLKIDSFFSEEGPNQNRDLALVESIISLVKKFSVQAIVEGIKFMEQIKFLRGIGCDYIQGYAFHHPMSQREYEALPSDLAS